MWLLVVRETGEVLGRFGSLGAANLWHDDWIDLHYPHGDHPACDFIRE